MRHCLAILAAACLWASALHAQWQMQTSHTTADLRGIDSLEGGIAWASGSHGIVLRTIDGGFQWRTCAMPPGAEHLDFRGVQAFDADTAIVMSSGPGDQSRLYKTTDGCASWKLIFPDPYSPDGFFDAILFLDPQHGLLFGDPSSAAPPPESPGDFRIRVTQDGGTTWAPVTAPGLQTFPAHGLHAANGESSFAASNSCIASKDGWFWFATSASRVSFRRIYSNAISPEALFRTAGCAGQVDSISGQCGQPWTDFRDVQVPIQHATPSSGIFSLRFRSHLLGVAVGGDYRNPSQAHEVTAFTHDGGKTWHPAKSMPHGYRSSVAYDSATNMWITVGPNGTDISRDDGRTWQAAHPDSALHQSSDADRNWNAISLPYVVGPHGRIGQLQMRHGLPTPRPAPSAPDQAPQPEK